LYKNRPISNSPARGVTRGKQGGTIPRAPNHYRGAKRLRRASKSPNNITSTVFNTVHMILKDLSFEHGGAKLASCPGRHLTSLGRWAQRQVENCVKRKRLRL